MMTERQAATYAQFGLDYSMQYHWDADRAAMIFSTKGVPIVGAGLQLVGSISGREGTCLWGWANESVPTAATCRLSTIRDYGREHGFAKLTEPEWVPEGDDGHEVTMVSACILDAPAIFHDHIGEIAHFFVLDNLERIGGCSGGLV
jgi:hypothetical protein